MSSTTADEARLRAEQHGVPFVDLDTVAVRRVVAAFLPETIGRRYRVVPIGEREGTPVIAFADLSSLGDLTAILGPSFIPVGASPEGVEGLLTYLYGDVVHRPAEGSPRNLQSSVSRTSDPTRDEPVVRDEVPDTSAAGTESVGNGHAPPPEFAPVGSTSLDDALRSILGGAAMNPVIEPTGSAEPPSPPPTDQPAAGQPPEAREASVAPMSPPFGTAATPWPSAGAVPAHPTLPPPPLPPNFSSGTAAEPVIQPFPDTAGAPRIMDVTAPLPPAATLPPPPSAPLGFVTMVAASDPALLPPPPSFPVASANGSVAPPPPPPSFTVGPELNGAASPPPPPGFAVSGPPTAPAAESADVGRNDEKPFTEGPPLAQALVASGHVGADEMRAALAGHLAKGESLARYLLNQGLASEDDLVWAMAQEVGLEFVDLSNVLIDRTASMLIPEATARRHMVLPIEFDDGVPVVAMANPTDVFAMDDLRSIMGRNFRAVVATRSQITTYMASAYGGGSSAADQAANQAVGERRDSGLELESLQAVVEDAPIVRYVNLLILQALNERASDIHIEPTEHRLRIRFRIDGVMHEATSASASISNSVVSRLKVLGEMDITEHRVPQEGRVSLSLGDRQLDLRLAVLPSVWGETVVMRILDKSSNLRSLPELGFLPSNLERYAKAYHQPYGVILVTGPTGAGKTTTLYATLKEVMTGEKAVVTVEDPVEYQLDGATQVQINTKAGLKFSTALRSILRADPDIVLIGEIRDAETAMIAMEAALSGHLVLSTLHTNTAAATPLRLTEMGIEPFLVTSAVGSVLTQRLARKLCPRCKAAVPASVADFLGAGYREADLDDVDTSVLYKAVGCRACGGNGYYGRMVLAEVLKMTEEINRLIITGGSIGEIEQTAISQGMTTLRRDGLEKAIAGDTTLEEVLRVVV